jgi:hypothetical protein
VPSYNAGINIVVSGQDRLNYVLNSVDKLSAVLAKLKPINLLAPGAGSGGDAIRVAKKQLDDFTRAIVNFQPQGIQKRAKELSNTLAGASEQASALSTVLANVGLKSGGFKQQAVEVRNYALALDTAARNAARVNTISQAVQRGARVQNIASRFNVSTEQVEQRLANIREAAAKRKAQLDAAERQRDVQKLLLLKREEDFEIRLGRIRERNAAADAKRKGRTSGLSDALIGGAFPLLFGQGIGASAGGALGGFAGAKIAGGKGGFGGSLAGTIVGQATIDFAINSAVELGQALRKPTENIEQLTKFLGIAGTELGTNVSVLQKLGLQSTASATALAKLEEILKAEGYKNLDTLSKQLTDLENAFSRLKLAAANLLSEPLTQFLNFLTDTIKLISRAGGVGGFITTSPEKLQAIDKQIQAERKGATDLQGAQPTQAELAAQKAITDEKQRQITLATAQKNLEADKLNLTRVDLATRQGAIAVQQVQNDLARKQLEYRNETTEAAKELLGLEVQVLQQQEAQAQAAQRNAIAAAERAVRQQKRGLFVDQIGLTNQLTEAKTEAEKIINGEAAGLASSILSTEARLSNERLILRARQAIEEEGVKENDVLKEIRVKYALLHQLAIERSANEHDVNQQLLVRVNLTQKQIDQQRANLQTEGRFKQELQRTQSFQDPTGFGFFGDALLNQKLAVEEYNLTLAVYNKQLTDLQENAATEGLNTDLGKKYTKDAAALKDQIALYKEYQPAIIQARLEQEKFNTILNATTPVVDNLFDSISNVVAGTMTAKEAFASFLNSVADMLADTAKKMIAQYIAIGIARMFAGFAPGVANAASPEAYAVGTGASIEVAAKGATFSNGIAKFARGGIVDSPTLFKFAQGGAMQTGLMGEAGPEAIMPLTRGPGGQLGVSNFGGGGDVNVVVNVDAKGSSVEGDQQSANRLGRHQCCSTIRANQTTSALAASWHANGYLP